MKFFLDGQDKSTAILFRRMASKSIVPVSDFKVKTNDARVLIRRIRCFLDTEKTLFPSVKLQLQGYVIGYDDVNLINAEGLGVLDRIDNLDFQKAIEMTYVLNREEVKLLIDAGAYDNVDFIPQLQNNFKNQIFTMPLTLFERRFKQFTLVESQIKNYVLNKRQIGTFDELYNQVIQKMIANDYTKPVSDGLNKSKNIINNNIKNIQFKNTLNTNKLVQDTKKDNHLNNDSTTKPVSF